MVALAVAGNAAADLPPFCQHLLAVTAGDAGAYQLRSEAGAPSRCEGRYVKKVGATFLTLGSLEAADSAILESRADAVRLEWSGAELGPLRISVESLKAKTFYRMDAEGSPMEREFTWPTTLMRELGVAPSDLGIVATVERSGTANYVPVRFVVAGGPVRSTPRLVVVPQRAMDELYVDVFRVDGEGAEAESPGALGRGFYPVHRPVTIELPQLQRPGTYRIEIGADLTGGGTDSRELLVHVPAA